MVQVSTMPSDQVQNQVHLGQSGCTSQSVSSADLCRSLGMRSLGDGQGTDRGRTTSKTPFSSSSTSRDRPSERKVSEGRGEKVMFIETLIGLRGRRGPGPLLDIPLAGVAKFHFFHFFNRLFQLNYYSLLSLGLNLRSATFGQIFIEDDEIIDPSTSKASQVTQVGNPTQ